MIHTDENCKRLLADRSLEAYADDDGILVSHPASNTTTRVTRECLASTPWDDLRAVLYGEREAQVIDHMTRVVGYYSRVANWNRSKLGELRDRQKGSYILEGTAKDHGR